MVEALASARRIACVLGLVVSARVHAAQAEEPPRPVHVALTWTRAPGAERCISPEELLARTRGRAASDTSLTLDARGADFLVVGRIEPRGEGFHTELVLRDGVGRRLGERTFDSAARSCRAVDESLVLALVVLMETPRVRAVARGESAEALAELVPPLRAEEPPSPRVAPVPSPPRSRAKEMLTLDLGLGASGVAGFVPAPTVGASVFGMIRPERFVPIVLRGAAYPFAVDRVTVPGEGISVRGFTGGAELCPLRIARGRGEGLGCAGAHLATLQAQPLGPRSSPGNLFFVLVPVRAEARLRLGDVSPYAAATTRFAPAAPAFTYRAPAGEEKTSFQVPWATVELELGLIWHALP
jgi:hypothetical protein